MNPRYRHQYADEDRFLGYFEAWDLWLQVSHGSGPSYFYALNGGSIYTSDATPEAIERHRNGPYYKAMLHALTLIDDPSISPNSGKPGKRVEGDNAEIPF